MKGTPNRFPPLPTGNSSQLSFRTGAMTSVHKMFKTGDFTQAQPGKPAGGWIAEWKLNQNPAATSFGMRKV